MAAPTTLSFRADKDKDTGQPNGKWKVFGPVELLGAGGVVVVTKKDGTTTEVLISKVSRSFDVEGVECAYGTLAEGE